MVSRSAPQGASELATRSNLNRISCLQLVCPLWGRLKHKFWLTPGHQCNNTRDALSHTNLTVDDDGGIDVGAEERLDDGVEVGLEGGGRVADGDAVVGQPGELLLHALHHRVQSLKKAIRCCMIRSIQ